MAILIFWQSISQGDQRCLSIGNLIIRNIILWINYLNVFFISNHRWTGIGHVCKQSVGICLSSFFWPISFEIRRAGIELVEICLFSNTLLIVWSDFLLHSRGLPEKLEAYLAGNLANHIDVQIAQFISWFVIVIFLQRQCMQCIWGHSLQCIWGDILMILHLYTTVYFWVFIIGPLTIWL